MNLAILQHTKDEPAGLFESYARQAGVPCEIIPLYTTTEVPPLNATHLLILGGPMSVNQEDLFPYLVDEKRLIRSFVAAGRPVLGVCLGAQLIASACGGRVFPCTEEIGWHCVKSTGSAQCPVFPPLFNAFQFHGETFTIPPGGERICNGQDVENQAFVSGSALGVQFHVEVTAGMIEHWISHLPEERQSVIMRDTTHHLQESARLCRVMSELFFHAPAYGHSWISH